MTQPPSHCHSRNAVTEVRAPRRTGGFKSKRAAPFFSPRLPAPAGDPIALRRGRVTPHLPGRPARSLLLCPLRGTCRARSQLPSSSSLPPPPVQAAEAAATAPPSPAPHPREPLPGAQAQQAAPPQPPMTSPDVRLRSATTSRPRRGKSSPGRSGPAPPRPYL